LRLSRPGKQKSDAAPKPLKLHSCSFNQKGLEGSPLARNEKLRRSLRAAEFFIESEETMTGTQNTHAIASEEFSLAI
jgi:hypothetical protein